MGNILNLLKKYLWLTIGVALALLLLAAIGVRLFFVIKSHQKEKQELNGAEARLDQLYQRAIFPSAVNISREKEKMTELVDEFNELHGLLAEDQVLPEQMEAAEFMTFFENTLRRIRDRLQTGRVGFPEKYTFGFEKYAGGMLPAPADIPRLVQQVKITERVCQILPDAAISELLSITRDEFESAVDTARAPPGRGRAAPPAAAAGPAAFPGEQLYSAQHFKISFKAREGSVLDLLNRLARLTMFTVVTSVDIINPRNETGVGSSGWAKSAADASGTKAAGKEQVDELSRDNRIVLGREELEVKIEMDVYNFGPPIDFKEGAVRKKSEARSQ
jgi:hypothetical protein